MRHVRVTFEIKIDTMKKLSLIYLTLVLMASGTFGQGSKSYLTSKDIQKLVDSETNSWQLQTYAVLFSKVGNYKASLATQHLYLEKNKAAMNIPEKPKVDSINFKIFKPKNAGDVISKAAKKYKVVITNEAHYQPQNRVFTSLLLEKLYQQGFRYLCVEDLSRDDTVFKSKEDKDLNNRKYPIKTSGYYMDEPQYGNLVRQALKLGYTLIAYEHYASEIKDPGERMMGREKGQAKNIAEILQKDPNAKILVHCGYGHLNENVVRDSIGQMAAMLKIHYQIDPLTIDQQDMLEENNDPYYRLTDVKETSVFVSENNFFSDPTDNHKVDMVVFFPKTKYVNGRPNWLVYDERKKYYFVKLEQNKFTYPIMISAFYKGEDISVADPTDIIEIDNPNDKVALVLNTGQYILQVKDATGNVLQQTVQVK